MGGFVFDFSQQSSYSTAISLPDGRQHLTLTPSAVIFLAANHRKLLPDISEAFILDKAKTTWITKSFVLGQALWFCCQCISRLVQGLPVTLLELNTIAHVLYAFFIYVIWWDKPLDISEPIEIRVSDLEVKQLCAAMCVKSSLFSRKRCDNYRGFGFLKPHNDQTLDNATITASDAEIPVASLPNDEEMQSPPVSMNRAGTSMATTLINESVPKFTGQDPRLNIDAPPRDAQCRPQDSTGPFQIALGETKKGISFDQMSGMVKAERIPQATFAIALVQHVNRRANDAAPPPVITVDEGTQALFSLASGYQNPSAIERQLESARSHGITGFLRSGKKCSNGGQPDHVPGESLSWCFSDDNGLDEVLYFLGAQGKDNYVNKDLFTDFKYRNFTRLPSIKELDGTRGWRRRRRHHYYNDQTNNPRRDEETNINTNDILSDTINMEICAPGLAWLPICGGDKAHNNWENNLRDKGNPH
ncbi:hypothetical protein Neosp_013501 [[Neocosmospora] mangrovei]